MRLQFQPERQIQAPPLPSSATVLSLKQEGALIHRLQIQAAPPRLKAQPQKRPTPGSGPRPLFFPTELQHPTPPLERTAQPPNLRAQGSLVSRIEVRSALHLSVPPKRRPPCLGGAPSPLYFVPELCVPAPPLEAQLVSQPYTPSPAPPVSEEEWGDPYRGGGQRPAAPEAPAKLRLYEGPGADAPRQTQKATPLTPWVKNLLWVILVALLLLPFVWRFFLMSSPQR